MNSIVYTIIMVALWVLNLFNDSGLGHIYQTTERARTIIVCKKRNTGNSNGWSVLFYNK